MHRRRPDRLAAHISPLHLFISGTILIACFLLQQNLIVRVAQVVAFAVLAILAGKRIRYGYFVIMVASITIFNLLTPVGEVLLRLGPLVITRGALHQGLMKGFAIPGMVFVSLFAVRPELKLPGAFGGMITRLFYYFEELLEGRKHIQLKRLVASIDELLLDLLDRSASVDAIQASAAGGTGASVSRSGAGSAPTAGASGGIGAADEGTSRSGSRTTLFGFALVGMLVAAAVACVVLFGTF